MLSQALVAFYKTWHGHLHIQGAGFLIRSLASILPGLQKFHLKLPEGHQITLDFRDISAFYWLNYFLGDRFEEHGLLIAISRHIKANSVLWDVGANCGLLSYRLAKETKVREIYFFEPNSTMFMLAKAATQPFNQVQGLPYALSDQCRTATLTIPDGRSATGTLEATSAKTTEKIMAIECKIGDQLVKTNMVPAPHIIKVDTEGHEVSVLRGLEEIIRTVSPIIFFEHISLTDEEVSSVLPNGYNIYTVSDESGSLILGFDRAVGHNSVLKPISSAA